MSYREGVGFNKCKLLPTPFQTCYSNLEMFLFLYLNMLSIFCHMIFSMTISVFAFTCSK